MYFCYFCPKQVLPVHLQGLLRGVPLRCYGARWLKVELSRADSISLHVAGEGSVNALILWQDCRYAKAGSSILENLNLVTTARSDALPIFVPSNLTKQRR